MYNMFNRSFRMSNENETRAYGKDAVSRVRSRGSSDMSRMTPTALLVPST